MTKNNEKSSDRLKIYNEYKTKKIQDILSKKNNFFYVSMILISIVMLAVAWLIESNTNSVDVNVFDGFDYRFLILILSTMLIIGLLMMVGDFVVIYRRLKVRKFIPVVCAILTQYYYSFFQIWGRNSDRINAEYLKASGIDAEFANSMTANKSISSRISTVIYSMIVLILGTIFAIKSINLFLYVVSIIAFVVLLVIVLFVLYFEKYPHKYLLLIGKLCKFLYKLKIVKDYEKLYNNLVSKMMYYGTALKFDKLYLILQIICSFIAKFLKHSLLFFILCSFNIGGMSIFIEVLFKCTVFDLIMELFPLPNGVLLYELIFLTLFRNTFLPGYVLYGMIGYRLVTYLIITMVFAIGYWVGIRKTIEKIRNQKA